MIIVRGQSTCMCCGCCCGAPASLRASGLVSCRSSIITMWS